MTKKGWLVLSLALLLGVAFAWAQSTFPVRLDWQIEEAAVAGTSVAVSGSALQLPPQSAPPFTCDDDHHGWMYLQCTDTSTTVFSSIVLCICQEDVPGGNDLWTLLHNDSQTCASVAGACAAPSA